MGIVEAIEQVNGSRPGRANANTELAGVLCVAAGHKSRGLLMPDPDVLNAIATLSERLDHRVDSISHNAKDECHAPFDERIHEDIGGSRVGRRL